MPSILPPPARASSKGSFNIVKVSDFGMSRAVETEENQGSAYYLQHAAKVPVRWTAPEALMNGKYTVKSDVWSYGVTVWELFADMEIPYGKMPVCI